MSSKWVIKQWRQLATPTTAFGSGTANEHTVQGWFKKPCGEDKGLEDEECGDRPLEVDSGQLRAIVEAVPLKLHEKSPKNSASIVLCSCGI